MVFFVCLLLGIALPHRSGAELQVSGLFLQFMCAPLHVLVVLLCVVLGASLVFWSFLVFFFLPPSSPFISLCLLLCITMFFFLSFFFLIIIFSTELLALCHGVLGRGWVWRAGLVAGLQVGQAFGMFLLPGFGVGSSSPWVPGHPTSMCDSGVK